MDATKERTTETMHLCAARQAPGGVLRVLDPAGEGLARLLVDLQEETGVSAAASAVARSSEIGQVASADGRTVSTESLSEASTPLGRTLPIVPRRAAER